MRYNLYVDSSNARIVKEMRDGIVAANPALGGARLSLAPTASASPRKASISTEGGAVQMESSVFFGVLTPFRNNQTDVTNPAYTGAIRGFDIQHILLASDTRSCRRPRSRRRSPIADSCGPAGRATALTPGSTLGPTQAPQIPFAWHNGTPTYPITIDPIATCRRC